jgi:hypothetical protein
MNKYPVIDERTLSDTAREQLAEIRGARLGIMLDRLPDGSIRMRIYAPNSRRIVCQTTCTAGADNAVHQGYGKWQAMQP